MRERILRHKVGVATIVAAIVVGLLTIYAVPLNPPLGDCFGGVLSKDPLHCYALEQARRQGVIDVQTVYDADGMLYFSLRQDEDVADRGNDTDEVLYFSLRRDTDVADNIRNFIKAKSSEFYDRWPDEVPDLSFYRKCEEGLRPTYRECYLEVGLSYAALPKSAVYDDIRFHTGGETGRRLLPGWATWRQVWPATASGASGSSETPTTFDVSDVDMTNLPVDACPEVLYGDPIDFCSRDQDVALSVVGMEFGGEKMYVQVKDPPEDAAGIHHFRKVIDPCYDVAGRCVYMATTTVKRIVDGVETHTATSTEVTIDNDGPPPPADSIVLISVKYSWEELARWAEILDRFATSRGNTIGIMRAMVGKNSWGSTTAVWTTDNLRRASKDSFAHYDPSSIRKTIAVLGFDAQRIAVALPTLLPLLGIPVDAVGFVDTEWRGSNVYAVHDVLALDVDTSPSPPVHFASTVGVPLPLLLLARNVGVVLVVGGVVALGLRLRRWRAPG